jgi:hypothetical protein
VQDAAKRLTPAMGRAATSTPATASPSATQAAASVALPIWQTPYLEPDEVLTLKLVIDPGRPRQTQQYAFRLTSTPIDHAGAEAQIVDTTMNIEGRSPLRMYLPVFIVVGVTLAILWAIALLLANSGALS